MRLLFADYAELLLLHQFADFGAVIIGHPLGDGEQIKAGVDKYGGTAGEMRLQFLPGDAGGFQIEFFV